MNEVNIILVPYNYILSEKVRNSIKINLENAVIIFDEAHNIENSAESACSLEIPIKNIEITS